jgi:hypothetical protein
MRVPLLVVACALGMASCASTGVVDPADVARGLRVDRHLMCPDGAPVKLFQDPHCKAGLCGYTCAPGRWGEP